MYQSASSAPRTNRSFINLKPQLQNNINITTISTQLQGEHNTGNESQLSRLRRTIPKSSARAARLPMGCRLRLLTPIESRPTLRSGFWHLPTLRSTLLLLPEDQNTGNYSNPSPDCGSQLSRLRRTIPKSSARAARLPMGCRLRLLTPIESRPTLRSGFCHRPTLRSTLLFICLHMYCSFVEVSI